MKLWAQIAVTLAINFLLLALLLAGLVLQQTKSGVDSFLYAPARERVRELGRQVEEEFPGLSAAGRNEWLAALQKTNGITLAVYDDRGDLVAGENLRPPPAVLDEMLRERGGARRRGRNPPIFIVKQEEPARYWIGYHFPLVLERGYPPARHTLTVVTPSLLTAPFFVDWLPWVAAAVLAILVTLACWLPLVRRLTRSLEAVRAASAEIAEGRFHVALPVKGRDELAHLAQSVRRMADQLSRLVNGQQRFLADVAHELCAPLSRIQLTTGILSQTPGASPVAVSRLEHEVAHMSALVGDLLSFTKGNVRKPELVSVPLAELAGQVIQQEAAAPGAVTNGIPVSLTVLADREYLQRALGNVVRNALRYAGGDGPIRIAAESSGPRVRLTVEDSGPGLPEADLDAVFSPFFRLDGVRTPGEGGAGLGLAIVKSCVEACGGTVSCRNRSPRGLAVVMELRSPAVTG